MDQLILGVTREGLTAKELAENGPDRLSGTWPITRSIRINDYPKEVYGRDHISEEQVCSIIIRSLTIGYPLFISEGAGNKECTYIIVWLSSWAPLFLS